MITKRPDKQKLIRLWQCQRFHLAQRYRGLLETIIAKPTISKEDLAAQFKISLTTLKRDLRSLRQSYEITWIGWTQNGHWEVKELDKKKQ